MTSRAERQSGFTLLEVMAAVLVLGLLYTVLASAAMRGLRSEGTDRRRADAEMIADRELTDDRDRDRERRAARGRPASSARRSRTGCSSNVEPIDVLALLPRAAARGDRARHRSARALAAPRRARAEPRAPRSRWWWSGTRRASRTTSSAPRSRYDSSVLAQYFPSDGEAPTEADAGLSELEKVRKDGAARAPGADRRAPSRRLRSSRSRVERARSR